MAEAYVAYEQLQEKLAVVELKIKEMMEEECIFIKSKNLFWNNYYMWYENMHCERDTDTAALEQMIQRRQIFKKAAANIIKNMQLLSPVVVSSNENVSSTARYITQTTLVLDQARKEYNSLWLEEQDQLRVVAECEERIQLLHDQEKVLQERKERVRIEGETLHKKKLEKSISIKKLEEALRKANTKEEIENDERLGDFHAGEHEAFRLRQSQENTKAMQGESKVSTKTNSELRDEFLVHASAIAKKMKNVFASAPVEAAVELQSPQTHFSFLEIERQHYSSETALVAPIVPAPYVTSPPGTIQQQQQQQQQW